MDTGLLTKMFGSDQQWQGPCTLILEADAAVQTAGSDAIVGSGTKVYAPRVSSGRIPADHVCLLQDNSALVAVQQTRIRQQTGEEIVKQTVTVIDPRSVVAVEFADGSPLSLLNLSVPAVRTTGSQAGLATRTK